jgi:UDP-N-acetylglucosamine 2-epimerase (non-hydrolysing)
MIDSLVGFENEIRSCKVLDLLGLKEQSFVLMTMHRPSNVDTLQGLEVLIKMIRDITDKLQLVFPVHPRTVARLKEFGLWDEIVGIPRLIFSEPMDYFSFQKLTASAKFVVTDSGGIQEETTYLKVPCLTLRNNTERPVTITVGSNVLVEYKPEELSRYVNAILEGSYKHGEVPPLWDGKTTERIVEILENVL